MKQPHRQAGITVFLSSAQADQAVREQLIIHLSQLKRDGLIEEWSDQQILAGTERAHEIDRAIHSAQIILLLISADFLASDACYQTEMQSALERHKRGEARVIPIIVRPCDWQSSPFAHLQCLPRKGKPITSWNDRDEAFLAVTQELRQILAKQQFSNPLLSNTQRQNRERLLKRVQVFWIDGLLKQSLHQAAWIDLHFQEQPDALNNPLRLQMQELDQPPHLLPERTSILQVYDEADGELLLLGEPGAGKTTLLLQLAQTLLDRAVVDEHLPMPVIFNLSSWAQDRQPLGQWLVEELYTGYQVPRKLGKQWIETHQILLLLDGLDEVKESARLACAQAISTYHQSNHAPTPLVICCRTQEYTTLSLHLPLQRAVSILPLTTEQIDRYLSSAQGQLTGLQQALHSDAELSKLAHRPLILNIFTLVYQGTNVAELPTESTSGQLLYNLFKSYVKRMLIRRRPLHGEKQEQFLRWITSIARLLYQQQLTTFSAEDIQPDWLPNRQKYLYQLCLRLLFGVLNGLFFVPLFSLLSQAFGGIYHHVLDMIAARYFGGSYTALFIFTFQIGLLLLIFAWLDMRKPFPKQRPLLMVTWSNFISQPLLILFAILVVGLFEQQSGLLVIGVFATIQGAVYWKFEIQPRHVVVWSWKQARTGLLWGWFVALLGGLLGASLALLLVESPFKPFIALLAGLISTLLLGLLLGLLFGLLGGFSTNQLAEYVSFLPNEGIRRSARNGLLLWLLGTLLFGLLFALLGALTGAWAPALLSGLLIGLSLGLTAGLDAFIEHFVLRFFLWRIGYLPWNLFPFLDEAVERLLLRKVGRHYIFIHRLLLDYFATLDMAGSTESTSAEKKR